MTAEGLLTEVSSRELTEWRVLYQLEAEEHQRQLEAQQRALQAGD